MADGESSDLTAAAIGSALSTRWLGQSCVAVDSCPSTNDLAAQRGKAGAPEGLIIVADQQTGGRGRLGRVWHSPAGQNLYLSILLRPTRPPTEIPPLTLLAGAALARALTPFGVVPRLKWPNDVQLEVGGQVRKVAGILTEMSTEGDRVAHVVVGIGINVNTAAFPEDLRDKATSLALARGRPANRLAVLGALLSSFELAYEQFRADGPRAAVALWGPHAALGTRCRVTVEGVDVDGIMLGLDSDGALRVRDNDGRVHRVVSGEVT